VAWSWAVPFSLAVGIGAPIFLRRVAILSQIDSAHGRARASAPVADGLAAALPLALAELIRQDHIVIASAAKQPRGRITPPLGCFVASLLAMTIQFDRTPL
jgi:hypothetical protein